MAWGRAPGWLKRNLGAAERLQAQKLRRPEDAGKRRGSPQRPRAPGRLLATPRRACVIGARLPGLGPAASSSYSAGRLAARWVSPARLEVSEMEVSAGRTHGAQIRKGALGFYPGPWRLPWRQGFNSPTRLGTASVLSGRWPGHLTGFQDILAPSGFCPASSPSGTRSPAKESSGPRTRGPTRGQAPRGAGFHGEPFWGGWGLTGGWRLGAEHKNGIAWCLRQRRAKKTVLEVVSGKEAGGWKGRCLRPFPLSRVEARGVPDSQDPPRCLPFSCPLPLTEQSTFYQAVWVDWSLLEVGEQVGVWCWRALVGGGRVQTPCSVGQARPRGDSLLRRDGGQVTHFPNLLPTPTAWNTQKATLGYNKWRQACLRAPGCAEWGEQLLTHCRPLPNTWGAGKGRFGM